MGNLPDSIRKTEIINCNLIKVYESESSFWAEIGEYEFRAPQLNSILSYMDCKSITIQYNGVIFDKQQSEDWVNAFLNNYGG